VASVFLLGKGNVGGHLLSQIHDRRAAIRRDAGIELRVVAVSNRSETLFDEAGLDLDALDSSKRRATHPLSFLDVLARLPCPVLVDCTAAEGLDTLYLEAFRRGIHVVTANKNPLTCAPARHAALIEAARRTRRAFCFETTVGADLPIVGPLADRLRSGDRVRRIEGSLSGTLGFLSDALMAGTPLTRAIEQAQAAGYTEPNPAEDLSGRDVARKALILARAMGLSLSLDDVALEPFAPAHALDVSTLVGLHAALHAIEVEVSTAVTRRKREGRVLRYLATIDPHAERPVRVGPAFVPADHPAAQLRGTEALVAIHTERCGDVPLVVRGPGAGGAVTASGVLADIVRAVG
jgi:aspartokinase/homoserine dehydrogenase 1